MPPPISLGHPCRFAAAIALVAALAALAALAGCGGERAMQPPPPPRWEQQTAAPKTPSAWIRGHWDWDGSQWRWVPGEWRKRPDAEARWQDGHYGRRRDGSWEWLPGRWREPGEPGYEMSGDQ